MKTFEVQLKSVSPLIMAKPVFEKKQKGETHEKHESRTWREKMHYDKKNQIYIPARAFKNTIYNTAKYFGENIPGEGKKTYTKKFASGIACYDDIKLGINKDDVEPFVAFVPSNGQSGGSTRVQKHFPFIPEWEGTTQLHVFDPTLLDSINKVEEYIVAAGKMIGLLAWRPANNGDYGRFEMVSFKEV